MADGARSGSRRIPRILRKRGEPWPADSARSRVIAGIRQFQGPAQEKLTVGDLRDALERDYLFREVKGLRQALGHFGPVRESFAHGQAVALTSDRMRLHMEKRRKEGRSNTTMNRETEVLRRA